MDWAVAMLAACILSSVVVQFLAIFIFCAGIVILPWKNKNIRSSKQSHLVCVVLQLSAVSYSVK